jgi:hypothetical protein
MIKLFKFDQVPLPVYKEVKGKEYIYYGEKNDYPNYLLRIYNNSAKHNAIVTGKVDYICGNGWSVKAEDEMQKAKAFGLIDRINTKQESLNELTKKLVTDLSIFGGYYLQVIWTKATGEIAELYHVDYYKVRTKIIGLKMIMLILDQTLIHSLHSIQTIQQDHRYYTLRNTEQEQIPILCQTIVEQYPTLN